MGCKLNFCSIFVNLSTSFNGKKCTNLRKLLNFNKIKFCINKVLHKSKFDQCIDKPLKKFKIKTLIFFSKFYSFCVYIYNVLKLRL